MEKETTATGPGGVRGRQGGMRDGAGEVRGGARDNAGEVRGGAGGARDTVGEVQAGAGAVRGCASGAREGSATSARSARRGGWTVRDVVSTVLLSVLLVAIQLVVNMVCMVNDFVSMTLSVGITMLLCGPVYVLMARRVGKRGVTLLYMTLLGIVFLLMGNWFLLPWFLGVGLVCEAILWKRGSYDNSARLTGAWTVASLLYNGTNLLPIWFFWDTYYSFAVASGMEQGYIDAYVSYFTEPGWVLFIVAFTTVCGFVGARVGSGLAGRHFKKAGVL